MIPWAFIIYYFWGVIFYDILPGPLQYIDEVFPWILLAYAIVVRKFKVPVKILILFGIFLFYFLYSVIIRSNTLPAILFDFIVQIKPFLVYFAILYSAPRFTAKHKLAIRIAMLCGAAVILAVGITRIGEEVQTLEGQILPGARFSFAAMYTGITYLYFSDRKMRDVLVSAGIMILGFCAITSKYLGGICLLMLTYALTSEKLKQYRIPCIVLGVLVCLPLSFNVLKDVGLYFESEEVARAALYLTAGRILFDYIPFGSGFASFGTSASANSYSDIYYDYEISGVYGLSEYSVNTGDCFISDAYVASLAEFGIVGIGIMLYFLVSCVKRRRQKEKMFAIFFVLDIIMESFADSTLIGNRGVFMMFMLALCSSRKKNKHLFVTLKDNERFS